LIRILALKGRYIKHRSDALSGLRKPLFTITQGVALGWYVTPFQGEEIRLPKQGEYNGWGCRSFIEYFLNLDYAEEDEDDDFKVFFSSYSSFSA